MRGHDEQGATPASTATPGHRVPHSSSSSSAPFDTADAPPVEPPAGTGDAEDAPSGTVLELGETCMVDYEVVGDCRDGYCDAVALDAVCVPFRAVGEDCFFAYECETGACDGGRCIAAFCNGGS